MVSGCLDLLFFFFRSGDWKKPKILRGHSPTEGEKINERDTARKKIAGSEHRTALAALCI